jgi:hypothetical protein
VLHFHANIYHHFPIQSYRLLVDRRDKWEDRLLKHRHRISRLVKQMQDVETVRIHIAISVYNDTFDTLECKEVQELVHDRIEGLYGESTTVPKLGQLDIGIELFQYHPGEECQRAEPYFNDGGPWLRWTPQTNTLEDVFDYEASYDLPPLER